MILPPHDDSVALADVNEPDLGFQPEGRCGGGRCAQEHRRKRRSRKDSDSDSEQQAAAQH